MRTCLFGPSPDGWEWAAMNSKAALSSLGENKGTPRSTSRYAVELSSLESAQKNLLQTERRLNSLLSCLAELRAKHGNTIAITLSFGTTVGDEQFFTRTLTLSGELLARLAAMGVCLQFSAYPCTEERLRKRLKWSEGVGRQVP